MRCTCGSINASEAKFCRTCGRHLVDSAVRGKARTKSGFLMVAALVAASWWWLLWSEGDRAPRIEALIKELYWTDGALVVAPLVSDRFPDGATFSVHEGDRILQVGEGCDPVHFQLEGGPVVYRFSKCGYDPDDSSEQVWLWKPGAAPIQVQGGCGDTRWFRIRKFCQTVPVGDGHRFLVSKEGTDPFIYDVETEKKTQLRLAPITELRRLFPGDSTDPDVRWDWFSDLGFVFSADGNELFYTRCSGDTYTPRHCASFRQALAGEGVPEWIPNSPPAAKPIHRRGQYLWFDSWSISRLGVWRLDPKNLSWQEFGIGCNTCAFSPFGDQIAFLDGNGQRVTVQTYHEASGTFRGRRRVWQFPSDPWQGSYSGLDSGPRFDWLSEDELVIFSSYLEQATRCNVKSVQCGPVLLVNKKDETSFSDYVTKERNQSVTYTAKLPRLPIVSEEVVRSGVKGLILTVGIGLLLGTARTSNRNRNEKTAG